MLRDSEPVAVEVMGRRALRGARAILTGASSGIGRALALRLAEGGAELLLTARRAERLAELVGEVERRGGAAAYHAGDIAEPAVREQLLATARQWWGALDLLINNAGLGLHGPLAETPSADLRRVMEVNFFAPLELTRSALPLLRAGRQPLVVNVGSVLGHRAVPGRTFYSASKFALHGLTDGWRAELAADGIEMLLISPSTTTSEFFDHALGEEDGSHRRRPAASPEWVARQIERAMRRGRHELILTWSGKSLVLLDRIAPGWMDVALRWWHGRKNRHER